MSIDLCFYLRLSRTGLSPPVSRGSSSGTNGQYNVDPSGCCPRNPPETVGGRLGTERTVYRDCMSLFICVFRDRSFSVMDARPVARRDRRTKEGGVPLSITCQRFEGRREFPTRESKRTERDPLRRESGRYFRPPGKNGESGDVPLLNKYAEY